VDRNVRVHAEQGGCAEAAETVETRKNFVEDDGQAGPSPVVVDRVRQRHVIIEDMCASPDNLDESLLE